MVFSCNPLINFATFSQFELNHFLALLLSENAVYGYLVNTTPPTFLTKLLQVFLSSSEDVRDVLAVIHTLSIVTFLQFELSHVLAQLLPKQTNGYLVNATSTILTASFCNFACDFVKV